MSVKAAISTVVEDVAREQGRCLAPVADDLKLLQSDLESLRFCPDRGPS